jgi:hypothetical protein
MTPLLNRLQTICRWDPSLRLSKLGQVSKQWTTTALQGSGIPGWLILTRDERSCPLAVWVPRKENPVPQVIRVVWDERCFEDTILRVEYTSTSIYIADIWTWNGLNLFESTNFRTRMEFLRGIFDKVYTPCPVFESKKIELRENLRDARGREYYTDAVGERGVFVEESQDVFEVVATDIPDVYKMSNGCYLRVRTMQLSRHLRSLGRKFRVKCTQNEDTTWSPIIDSLSDTNGTKVKD